MSADGLHFVALPGSLRRGSYTRAIADTLDELAPDDVGIEVLGFLENLLQRDTTDGRCATRADGRLGRLEGGRSPTVG